MPISRQEFEDDRIDLGIPIADYLSVRRDDAFTAQEIFEAMIGFGRPCTFAEVVQALERLAREATVEGKEFAGVPRYIIKAWVYNKGLRNLSSLTGIKRCH